MITTNYRGILLLDIGYKVLLMKILHRFKVYTKEIIVDYYQNGFMKGIANTIFTGRLNK